jgi:hypothetical protein
MKVHRVKDMILKCQPKLSVLHNVTYSSYSNVAIAYLWMEAILGRPNSGMDVMGRR